METSTGSRSQALVYHAESARRKVRAVSLKRADAVCRSAEIRLPGPQMVGEGQRPEEGDEGDGYGKEGEGTARPVWFNNDGNGETGETGWKWFAQQSDIV